VKPLAAFYADVRAHRGVSPSCRACRLARDERERRTRGVPAIPRFDDPPGSKTCRRCLVTKLVAEFSAEPRNRDGLRSWCDHCTRERTLLWHRANPMGMQRLKTLRRTMVEAGTVTEADWLSLLNRHGYCCAYCGGAGPVVGWSTSSRSPAVDGTRSATSCRCVGHATAARGTPALRVAVPHPQKAGRRRVLGAVNALPPTRQPQTRTLLRRARTAQNWPDCSASQTTQLAATSASRSDARNGSAAILQHRPERAPR
jgi:hypothetical protein